MDRGRRLSIDVFTVGEAMLRLSTPRGSSLESASSFDVHVAGAEANVALALSRLDRRVAWASRLPDTALGRRVLSGLRAAGVDCSGVILEPEGRMGTYFVDIHAPPRSTRVIYDRAGSTVCTLTADDLDWDLISHARVIHLTGITPALSDGLGLAVSEVAQAAASSDALLSFDVNYRAKLWSPETAAIGLSPIMRLADLVICGRQDARDVFGVDGEPNGVARRLSEDFAIPTVVVTDGPRGSWWISNGRPGHLPAWEVEVVDRLGAGDAFTAGVIDGLLDGDLVEGIARGTALAAIALTTKGDSVDVARSELDALIAGERRDVDR